jgi:hypothetical protein
MQEKINLALAQLPEHKTFGVVLGADPNNSIRAAAVLRINDSWSFAGWFEHSLPNHKTTGEVLVAYSR